MDLVTGSFDEATKANRAVTELLGAHFDPKEISVVVADREDGHEVPIEYDTGVAEGAVTGATIGAALAALGTTLVATGVVVAPGASLWAAGPLLAILRGVAAAGVTGAVGALSGLGFWREEADLHAKDLREGAVLISVHVGTARHDAARQILRRTGATRVQG
jgi:hypothetical protein